MACQITRYSVDTIEVYLRTISVRILDTELTGIILGIRRPLTQMNQNNSLRIPPLTHCEEKRAIKSHALKLWILNMLLECKHVNKCSNSQNRKQDCCPCKNSDEFLATIPGHHPSSLT